ncbi:ABC transporter-associated protein EcsC [Salipaludibacillus neizhouensis]|uniref:ABC transporter-associated protein EcsC n=1 Tax=Salipaludibacillus neizhouensis TaxID=885475 RepID=A0A3A9KDJ8_9BACI|nr:EcsC family protein [Salipaludibacillus neizhouensis]RKL68541.1 ABC transporter-associated protein EcsC [Salipaludibacillus neizhouensis]
MTEELKKLERELERWEYRSLRTLSMPEKVSKRWQNKINNKLPDKLHRVVTEGVKQMIRATIASSDYLSGQPILTDISLTEREKVLDEKIKTYKRTAALEGAGTGFGGIFLGIADFPLLLNIKMKFLFDTAKIYGHDVENISERLFLLHVFQLAFSKEQRRVEAFEKVTHWQETKESWVNPNPSLEEIDWKSFQLEYRDFIDLPKTLQLIPGFGAIVGATANYHYLDMLAYHAKNSYRHREIYQTKVLQ